MTNLESHKTNTQKLIISGARDTISIYLYMCTYIVCLTQVFIWKLRLKPRLEI